MAVLDPLKNLKRIMKNLKRIMQEAISPQPNDSHDPDAPFAMVGARIKPRQPLNRSSIAVQPESYFCAPCSAVSDNQR